MEDKNKKNKNRKDTQLLTVEDIIREEGVKDEKNKTRIMSMAKPEIDIAWMYPDTLYLHGDRGNVMALVRYALCSESRPRAEGPQDRSGFGRL